MRIEIGNHPQEQAFPSSRLAGNRDTFADLEREIYRAQMKPAQRIAFEHAEELSFRNFHRGSLFKSSAGECLLLAPIGAAGHRRLSCPLLGW